MKSILAFHGSPGSAGDFQELANALSPHAVQRVVRSGYPRAGYLESDETPYEENLPNASIYLGYSWGATSCLRAVAKTRHDVEKIFLVAPFIKASPAGFVKKMVLGSEWLARRVLASKVDGIVAEFMEKTSAPASVPDSYRVSAKALRNVEVLRRSVLEKEESAQPMAQVLGQVHARQIPVVLIWGGQDAVGTEADQIEPLRQSLNIEAEHKIEDGGHALLWTHTEALASHITNYISDESNEK